MKTKKICETLIQDELENMIKTPKYQGLGYPYNELSDRQFEILLFHIFKSKINAEDFILSFDDVALMPGVNEQGRDSIIYCNQNVVGIIQCKKEKSRISQPKMVKEIIKFILFYLKDNNLISDINNFTYFFAVSTGFSVPAISYIHEFNERIKEEKQLEEWTNEVINRFETFKDFCFKDIERKIRQTLTTIKIRKITPEESLSLWLEKLPDVEKLFFDIKSRYIEIFNYDELLTDTPLNCHHIDIPFLERKGEVKYINDLDGDVLISAQPGMGKSFLLYYLIKNNKGKFINTNDFTKLAIFLKTSCPPVLAIDDAAGKIDLVQQLKRFRTQNNLSFQIIATCWSFDENNLQMTLEIGEKNIKRLPEMSNNKLIQVINNMGIFRPNWLLHLLLKQSFGRPGLAVFLCQLLVDDGDSLKEIYDGSILIKHFQNNFEKIVGDEAYYLLGCIAVGGDHGIDINNISDYLDIPSLKARNMLNKLASGGVLKQHSDQVYSVIPDIFAAALIKDIFISESPKLPIEGYYILYDKTNSKRSAYSILLQAINQGAVFSIDKLHEMILETDGNYNDDLWKRLAYSSKESAKWIIDKHQEKIIIAANGLLHNAPQKIIPFLLEKAIGDERLLNSNLNHPLRIIEDWIKGIPLNQECEIFDSRELLFEKLVFFYNKHKDLDVTLKTINIILTLDISGCESKPGNDNAVYLLFGLLPYEVAEKIYLKIWPKVISFLDNNKEINILTPIIESVRLWAFPLSSGNFDIKDASKYQEIAKKMINDLASRSSIGDKQHLIQFSQQLGHKLEYNLDEEKEFLILFPTESHENDLETEYKIFERNAKLLAEQWLNLPIKEVVKRLNNYESEAQNANITYPRLTPAVCNYIAQNDTERLSEWIKEMMKKESCPDLLNCILFNYEKQASRKDFKSIILECMKNEKYVYNCLYYFLSSNKIDIKLLQQKLSLFEKNYNVIRNCIRETVPVKKVEILLKSDLPNATISTVLTEFRQEGSVRKELKDAWSDAVIKYLKKTKQYRWQTFYNLDKILDQYRGLAFRWLKANIEAKTFFNEFILKETIKLDKIIPKITNKQRMTLLKLINEKNFNIDIVSALVGDQADIFKSILTNKELSEFKRLVPLRGSIKCDNWLHKAKIAYQNGFNEDIIIEATYGNFNISRSKESDMFKDKLESFEELLENAQDIDEKTIAKAGIDYYKQCYEERLIIEKQIYG